MNAKAFPQPKQEDVDRAARELYDPARLCQFCHKAVNLAQQLEGRCPHCDAIIMAGPIDPERARVMLATLKARRASLGLDATTCPVEPFQEKSPAGRLARPF